MLPEGQNYNHLEIHTRFLHQKELSVASPWNARIDRAPPKSITDVSQGKPFKSCAVRNTVIISTRDRHQEAHFIHFPLQEKDATFDLWCACLLLRSFLNNGNQDIFLLIIDHFQNEWIILLDHFHKGSKSLQRLERTALSSYNILTILTVGLTHSMYQDCMWFKSRGSGWTSKSKAIIYNL